MKKLLGLLILAGVLFSCAEGETYQGNFLMFEGDAVLEVDEYMYTVKADKMGKRLAEEVKASQNTEFDMVPVTIKAVVEPKPADTEGWDSILTIKKIVEISPSAVAPDIQIEETQQ